jgi:hypothetical protein
VTQYRRTGGVGVTGRRWSSLVGDGSAVLGLLFDVLAPGGDRRLLAGFKRDAVGFGTVLGAHGYLLNGDRGTRFDGKDGGCGFAGKGEVTFPGGGGRAGDGDGVAGGDYGEANPGVTGLVAASEGQQKGSDGE